MTVAEGAVGIAEAQTSVPAPRPAPRQEERPRRRHEGFYWDVSAADWKHCPGPG